MVGFFRFVGFSYFFLVVFGRGADSVGRVVLYLVFFLIYYYFWYSYGSFLFFCYGYVYVLLAYLSRDRESGSGVSGFVGFRDIREGGR